MNRKQRRAAAKMAQKSDTKALADKMFQFDKLGDSCLVCDAPFDKKQGNGQDMERGRSRRRYCQAILPNLLE